MNLRGAYFKMRSNVCRPIYLRISFKIESASLSPSFYRAIAGGQRGAASFGAAASPASSHQGRSVFRAIATAFPTTASIHSSGRTAATASIFALRAVDLGTAMAVSDHAMARIRPSVLRPALRRAPANFRDFRV